MEHIEGGWTPGHLNILFPFSSRRKDNREKAKNTPGVSCVSFPKVKLSACKRKCVRVNDSRGKYAGPSVAKNYFRRHSIFALAGQRAES